MPIPKIFQIPVGVMDGGPAVGSVSYHAVKGLLRFRLIRHNAFGIHSPFLTCEKITSVTVKIFIAFPLLTLCAAVDLTIWLIKTATICMIVRDKQRHFIHLIALVALPILSLGICMAGKSPALLCPSAKRRIMEECIHNLPSHANDGGYPIPNYPIQDTDPFLLRECLQEGFHEDYEGPKIDLKTWNDSRRYIQVFQHCVGLSYDPVPVLNYDLIQRLLKENYIQPNDAHGKDLNDSSLAYEMAEGGLYRTGDHPILVEAARRHDPRLIDILVAAGADPNLIYQDLSRKANILIGLMKFKVKADIFAKILTIPGLDIDLKVQGTTAIAVALLREQRDCVKQLAQKGANLHMKHLEQMKLFLDAFDLKENDKAPREEDDVSGSEVYVRELMNKVATSVSGEHYESNIYFQAILNRRLSYSLRSLFFKFLYYKRSPEHLQSFKTSVNATIQFFKKCIRERCEEVDNICSVDSRVDGEPKRTPRLPKVLVQKIAEFLA